MPALVTRSSLLSFRPLSMGICFDQAAPHIMLFFLQMGTFSFASLRLVQQRLLCGIHLAFLLWQIIIRWSFEEVRFWAFFLSDSIITAQYGNTVVVWFFFAYVVLWTGPPLVWTCAPERFIPYEEILKWDTWFRLLLTISIAPICSIVGGSFSFRDEIPPTTWQLFCSNRSSFS